LGDWKRAGNWPQAKRGLVAAGKGKREKAKRGLATEGPELHRREKTEDGRGGESLARGVGVNLQR